MMSSLGVKLLPLGLLIDVCVLQIDSWCVSPTYGVEFPGYIVLGRDSCHQGSTYNMVSTLILVEANAMQYTRWMCHGVSVGGRDFLSFNMQNHRRWWRCLGRDKLRSLVLEVRALYQVELCSGVFPANI